MLLKARLGLLLTAFIWGSTFVTQRIASDSIGPLAFNSIRFFLAAIALLPVIYFMKDTKPFKKPTLSLYLAGAIIGFLLFIGAWLQQIGITYTSAGKTAFITALYIALVPVFGLFLSYRLSFLAIGGIISSLCGIALLTLNNGFCIAWADIILIISTAFWAIHILTLSYFSPRYPCIRLSAYQFLFAGIFNGLVGFFSEPCTVDMVIASWFPIFYGGVVSGSIGFTLQTLFQRVIPPTQVALILSLEMVFAAILGWLLLGETLTSRELLGVLLLSIGVVAAQIPVSDRFSIAPLHIFSRS